MKNRGKKGLGLRIRRENEKIENHKKERLATLKRLKQGEVEEKPKTGECGRYQCWLWRQKKKEEQGWRMMQLF